MLWFSTWLWGQTCFGYELWPDLASWTCDIYKGYLHFHPSCLSALPSCIEGRQSFEWHPFEAYQQVMLPNWSMPCSRSVPASAFKLEIWKLLTIWVLTHRCGGWASWREANRKQAEALSPQTLPPPQISAQKDKEVGGEIPSAVETDDTAMFYSGPCPPRLSSAIWISSFWRKVVCLGEARGGRRHCLPEPLQPSLDLRSELFSQENEVINRHIQKMWALRTLNDST